MGRKHARESTMKLLYQSEVNKNFTQDDIDIFLDEGKYSDDEKKYIIDAYEKITNNLNDIDKKIETHLKGWKKDRLAKIDLSTLRIAIYEITYRDDIPVEVSINEALEISKKYSSEESSKFINGVLGSIVRDNNG